MTEIAMKRPVREVADYLADYWATYNKQACVDSYGTPTVLADALYGIGVALNGERYECADGFARFKRDLHRHLSAELGQAGLASQQEARPAAKVVVRPNEPGTLNGGTFQEVVLLEGVSLPVNTYLYAPTAQESKLTINE